ncbi:MAG TPA: TraB/GumN family protein [Candidatus Limnocylindria bacterium]|nr:TraB/GumN family protein [Candidatus Limnocylindria bacterium]
MDLGRGRAPGAVRAGGFRTRPRWPAAAVALLAATLATAAAAANPTSRRGAPLLWRVEWNGRRSHLFGTVHLPLDLDAALGDEGRTALADAKRVFLEIDTSPEAALTFLLQALHRAELPDEQSLHALLRPPTWTRLTTATKGFLRPELLDRLEPWFVALAVVHLAVPPGRPPPGIRPGRLPLDQQIGERARTRGIPTEGLESILDHLQVLSRMPRQEGIAMVEEALANPAANRDALATLVGAYIAEDDRPLLKAFGKLARRKPALAERLLYRRNQAWCERLVRWLRDGRMFVAAGAAHMFGDRGLVTLLRERGYLVERVHPTAASASTSARGSG